MAVLTPQQTTAIDTALSVSLPTLTNDRIIELCLLQRAAPEVKPEFVEALNTEITRRFTAAEIAANDVMFSVIQNFSNTLNPLANYQTRMYELSTTDVGLRNDWFRDNATFFYELLHDAEALAWLVTQTELVTYIFNSTVAFDAVIGSSYATGVFFNSPLAAKTITASSEAMNVVISNTLAFTAFIESTVAMLEASKSSVALAAIVKSTEARNALMTNNSILQANLATMLSTVKLTWTKQTNILSAAEPNAFMVEINTATSTSKPIGFIFASLGKFNSSATGKSQVTHSNGVLANEARTSNNPKDLTFLDVVTFNGAVFKAVLGQAQAYAELWIPPTT